MRSLCERRRAKSCVFVVGTMRSLSTTGLARSSDRAVQTLPARRRSTESVDRGESSAGGSVEREPRVLPGRVLAESCQSLHVAPDGSRVRLVLFRQPIGVAGPLSDSSSRCTARSITSSRVAPISWEVAHGRIVRSVARSASSTARKSQKCAGGSLSGKLGSQQRLNQWAHARRNSFVHRLRVSCGRLCRGRSEHVIQTTASADRGPNSCGHSVRYRRAPASGCP